MRRCRAFTLAVEDLAQVGILREPGGDLVQRHGAQLLDEGIGRHAGAGLEIARGLFVEMAFLALQLGDELVAHQRAFLVAGDAGELLRPAGVKLILGSTTTGCMAVMSCRAS